MEKKSNIISINLSDKSVAILQIAGVLTKQKKKKGNGSLSCFISSIIENFAEVHRIDWRDELELNLLKKRVGELNRQQDNIIEEIRFLSSRSANIRESKRLKIELSAKNE